jgi:hypothetical protein
MSIRSHTGIQSVPRFTSSFTFQKTTIYKEVCNHYPPSQPRLFRRSQKRPVPIVFPGDPIRKRFTRDFPYGITMAKTELSSKSFSNKDHVKSSTMGISSPNSTPSMSLKTSPMEKSLSPSLYHDDAFVGRVYSLIMSLPSHSLEEAYKTAASEFTQLQLLDKDSKEAKELQSKLVYHQVDNLKTMFQISSFLNTVAYMKHVQGK